MVSTMLIIRMLLCKQRGKYSIDLIYLIVTRKRTSFKEKVTYNKIYDTKITCHMYTRL